MKISFVTFFVFIVFTTTNFAQSFLDNTSLSIGYGIQEQDRRLFDFPKWFEQVVVPMEESSMDQSFSIQLNKKIISIRNFDIQLGMGYNRFVSKFTRPFNHCSFLEDGKPCHLILLYVDKYVKQQLQSPITISYGIPFEKNRVGVSLLILPNFNFHKKVITTRGGSTKGFEFSFDGLEVNPGISYQVNRVRFNLHYRLFNLMSIDRTIFYRSLYRTISEQKALAEQKFETYNPTKFWLFVSYDF